MQLHKHPSSLLHRLSNLINTFKNRGGNITEDLVTGVILQEARTPPSLESAVLSHLEAGMTENQSNPSFPTCEMVLESCYQQARKISHDNGLAVIQPSFNLLRLADDETTPCDSYSQTSIHPTFF
ncbi:hypothetical protein O181_021097 [Austropuccinia psidii MF-1]|uniref:Uncharacterized protein n=1 Tax=Austropuccinia psidii MF-1 TaxID=1389203 RepID=A0A9Q3CEU1_9BASI|nr:hypothetical protein [Austropuccinia psidii MF-1]